MNLDVIDFGLKITDLPEKPVLQPYQSSRLPDDHLWQNAEFLSSCTIEQPHKNLVVNYFDQTPSLELPWHVDGVMRCAYNMILGESVSPVTFESGDYTYQSGLLRVCNLHMVKPQPASRLIFKVSFRDQEFEDVAAKIKANYDYGQSVSYEDFLNVMAS